MGWPAPGKLIQKKHRYVKGFFGEPENILLMECQELLLFIQFLKPLELLFLEHLSMAASFLPFYVSCRQRCSDESKVVKTKAEQLEVK